MISPFDDLHIGHNCSVVQRAGKLTDAAAVLLYVRTCFVGGRNLPTVRLVADAERTICGENLSGMQNSAFRRLLWVSGCAALQGDCITGHIHDGRMYLTNRRADVAQYQKMAGQLLKRSSPLMEIYGQDRQAAFAQFLRAGQSETGPRRSILSSLPISEASSLLRISS